MARQIMHVIDFAVFTCVYKLFDSCDLKLFINKRSTSHPFNRSACNYNGPQCLKMNQMYQKLQKNNLKKETSSPKGNDRSPESNVPRSNLISKNI